MSPRNKQRRPRILIVKNDLMGNKFSSCGCGQEPRNTTGETPYRKKISKNLIRYILHIIYTSYKITELSNNFMYNNIRDLHECCANIVKACGSIFIISKPYFRSPDAANNLLSSLYIFIMYVWIIVLEHFHKVYVSKLFFYLVCSSL